MSMINTIELPSRGMLLDIWKPDDMSEKIGVRESVSRAKVWREVGFEVFLDVNHVYVLTGAVVRHDINEMGKYNKQG